MKEWINKIFDGSKRTIAAIFTVSSIVMLFFKIPQKDMITAYMYTLIFLGCVSGVVTADKILTKYFEK